MVTPPFSSVLLCSPDFFQVSYVINPWMQPGTVDQSLAFSQWQTLKETLTALGITVHTIAQEPSLPDMVFAADQAIVKGKQVLLSTFCHKERQGETAYYNTWFADHGYQVESVGEHCFEGGECLWSKDRWFVGTGFRASVSVVPRLQQFVEAPVMALELVDPRFYHLDTCLFVVDETTVFYYPPAFSVSSQQLLQSLIPNLVPFSEAEVLGFAANSIRVGDTILVHAGAPTFVAQLEAMGVAVQTIDIGEFVKAGGGIHCLILPLYQ